MNENNIQLRDKIVGEIEGEYYIPSYQRGYRWDEVQVNALLNDIYENGDEPYCLQPIVVRKDEQGRYEVIDGQQRLTTLYIVYQVMKTILPDPEIGPKYSLTYETRKENQDFFNNMDDEEVANTNIDFFFIHKAYCTAKEWFASKGNRQSIYIVSDFLKRFDHYVRVIWYELQGGTEAETIEIFKRLNIGRIPLTNAELVKALFLCRQNYGNKEQQLSEEKQQEIALQWDTIERELHDEDFWYFLTNKQTDSYPTRIELLFDFMSSGKVDSRDKYATFFFFNKQRGELLKLWEEITRYYYRLKEWYRKNGLYHKIGYLVASHHCTIDALMNELKDSKKSEMGTLLDQKIKDSIDFKKPYGELSYENDYDAITRVLLLFNVVSLMKNDGGARFPFKEFNKQDNDRWSLEHIHAQNSLKLNTQDKWKEWLKHHLDSVKDIATRQNEELYSKLLSDIQSAIASERLTDVLFTELSNRITRILSEENGTVDYVHLLSNMALLQASANSALSNGLFDAKRRVIIKMDSQGQYIPYCTRMVFLKYYTSEKQGQVSFHFWGAEDRKAYINKMNEILHDYLKEEIQL